MNKTVQHTGIATKLLGDPIEIAKYIIEQKKVEFDNFYDNQIEFLCQEYPNDYFYYPKNNSLYSVTKNTSDSYEIIETKILNHLQIEYIYNGSGNFAEYMEESFDKLDLNNITYPPISNSEDQLVLRNKFLKTNQELWAQMNDASYSEEYVYWLENLVLKNNLI